MMKLFKNFRFKIVCICVFNKAGHAFSSFLNYNRFHTSSYHLCISEHLIVSFLNGFVSPKIFALHLYCLPELQEINLVVNV